VICAHRLRFAFAAMIEARLPLLLRVRNFDDSVKKGGREQDFAITRRHELLESFQVRGPDEVRPPAVLRFARDKKASASVQAQENKKNTVIKLHFVFFPGRFPDGLRHKALHEPRIALRWLCVGWLCVG
jgi:hypothetical protein